MMKFYKISKSDFQVAYISLVFNNLASSLARNVCFRDSFYVIKPTLNPEGWSYIRPNVGFCFLMYNAPESQSPLKTIFLNKELAIKKVFDRHLTTVPLNHEF